MFKAWSVETSVYSLLSLEDGGNVDSLMSYRMHCLSRRMYYNVKDKRVDSGVAMIHLRHFLLREPSLRVFVFHNVVSRYKSCRWDQQIGQHLTRSSNKAFYR
jgi:hypothetical protein